MQSLIELGMNGAYEGVSGIVIPSLCDSLKVAGENWKCAISSIPFIPMTYPQNRKFDFGVTYTQAGYERVIRDLEKFTGQTFDQDKLDASLKIYNEHNAAMRELAELLAEHSEIAVTQRSDIFKSAYFMLKEEHTALVREFILELKTQPAGPEKLRIMTTGILADAPALTAILDEYQMQVVVDDIAAESRQYRVDAPETGTPLHRLALKFSAMGNCSVLYDEEKSRIQLISEQARIMKVQGILVVLTKFCDPEEFDYPFIKRSCEADGLPCAMIEVDRQMVNYEQARTAIEAFRDLMVWQ
jgi:benzoyl-CoA reductase/2-hydroxyglutaryl-CoA dehydratase subunit BcrC/BadD/HgdB